MVFSGLIGLKDDLEDRLIPIRAQLFPRQLLLELQDDALKGQVLRGAGPEPVSIDLPLPPLTCLDGQPLEKEPLGDLIGDLLVRDGLLDAVVLASLPEGAVEWRVIDWPSAALPDDPIEALRTIDPSLGFAVPLAEATIDLRPLPGSTSRLLLAVAPRKLVEDWIDVFNLAGGTMEIGLEQSNFKDRSVEREEEYVYLNGKWDESTGEQTGFDSRDGETGLRLVHKRSLGQSELQLGMELRRKNRVTRYTEFQWEADKETDPVVYEEDGVIQSTIRERRTDPFVMLTGRAGPLQWQTGMRFESTRTTVESDSGTFNSKSSTLLPSLNLRYGLSEASRLSLSLAKTVRRPAFNTLLPELLDGEFGDNDYIGNPQLLLETATGVDLGFEQRLGRRGVLGINLFHRKVNRLIELVNTGEPSEAAVDDWEDDIKDYMKAKGVSRAAAVAANPFDPDSFVYTSRNVGSGKVWGVELDLASPLTALGLPETGVFFNYSWLNSSVRDFMGERRFNNQARSLMNVGFIHNLPQLQTSFGMSYRKQGTAFSRVLGEEITTTYGGDLDMFIEKRVGKSFSVRLAGTNLLNAKKKEVFNKFDTLSDQMKRKYDEYEVESEKAGPRLQLVARWAF